MGMTGSILTGLHDVVVTNSSSDNTTGGDSNDDDIASAALMAFSSDNENDDSSLSIWGDTLGLLSAVGYGAYAIMVRVLCPRDESLMSMQLFLGFVGLWNMVLLSPFVAITAWTASTSSSSSLGLTWLVFGCLIVKGERALHFTWVIFSRK